MNTAEICLLTPEALTDLLIGRSAYAEPDGSRDTGQRGDHRWPFPGTVQFWVSDNSGLEQLELGTCLNMSTLGLGMLCDEPLPIGQELAIAVHQPEVSFHGHAVVRHCTTTHEGYCIGLQFIFDVE